MLIIKPPQEAEENVFLENMTIFLAGSIEMGTAEEWQKKIEIEMRDYNITILNPRRDNWNPERKGSINNVEFVKQVNWEINGIEKSNIVIFYFDPKTKSPITMLELGLCTKKQNIIVCCPDGFWKKGNIDIVCKRYNIEQVSSLYELVNLLKFKNSEFKIISINNP